MARFTTTNYYKHEIVNDIEECDLLNNFFSQLFTITRPMRYYTIHDVDLYRPDILSYRLYQTVDYWWILLKYNNIDDIWNDMKIGSVISIPNVGDIEDFYIAAKKLANKIGQ